MKRTSILLGVVSVLALILSACATPTPAPAPTTAPTTAPTEEAMTSEATAETSEATAPTETAFDATIKADSNYNIAIVLKNNTAAFWAQHQEGAAAAAKDLGVTVKAYAPQKPENIEEQIGILEDLITQGVQCIALAPTNSDSIVSGVVEVNDANIPLVYDNTMGPKDKPYLTYVGIDNYSVGQQLGDYVAKAMGEKGNLLLLEGVVGQSTSDLRSQGAMDALAKYPDITVSEQPANWDATQAADVTTNELTRLGGNLNAIISAGSGMSEAAAEAAKAYGVNMDNIVIGSFDVTDAVVEAIQNGDVDFTIDQQPYWQAYYSIAACVQYLNGMDVPSNIGTPVAFVTLDNLAEHIVK